MPCWREPCPYQAICQAMAPRQVLCAVVHPTGLLAGAAGSAMRQQVLAACVTLYEVMAGALLE